MLTIFYSPHMTSVDNESKRASGHADVPLSRAGREQAVELGRYYAMEKLDAVFHSDLQRATATAQLAFATRGLPLISDARLREYDYGDLTQHPVAEVEAEFPRCIAESFPRGESLVMVVQRMGAFLRDALSKYDGKTILIVGHRATRYGLECWCSDTTLGEIVNAPWPWLEVPIWRYALYAGELERKELQL